jgi:hypothetical protein
VLDHRLSHPTYTMHHPGHHGYGMPMQHNYPPMHGFCHSCCHPITQCCCGSRECRKEAKELLVSSELQSRTNESHIISAFQALYSLNKQIDIKDLTLFQDKAFIGGGCCVHLSVEFMPKPVSGTNSGAVLICVIDSEGTTLQWMKTVEPGSGYKIKEAIISTNPGAILYLTVFNVIARVRWCECFSC